MRGEQGMTLVEMLVVLAIVGIMAGVTALGIGAATRPPDIEAEARRLAGRLQAAGDEALVGGQPHAFAWDERSYTLLGGEGAPTRHRLPGGMTLAPPASPRPVPLALDGTDGMGAPLALQLAAGGHRWLIRYDGITATAAAAP